MATRRLRVYNDEDIQKIATTYHKWRTTGEAYEDMPGFCKAAAIDEVKANDYKLTPGIYVGTEAEKDDGIPFEKKMTGLKAKLKEQFEQSNTLQSLIIKNLNDI